jgi:hypothetical protein
MIKHRKQRSKKDRLHLYAAMLLFQWRTTKAVTVRRSCEKRIINFRSRNARTAWTKATRHGRDAEYKWGLNEKGKAVHFEFIGILDLLELGVECGPDEVWYDVVEMVKPMERRRKLIPPKSRLNALRNEVRRKTGR